MKIQKGCTRIESLLYKSCCNVKSKSTKLVGRARGQYLSGQRKIAIREDEIGLVSVHIDHMEDEISRMRENEQKLLEENDQLQKRCEDLYKELQTARQAKDEMENNLEDVQNSYDEITSKNIELREYIKTIADSDDMKNNGKVVTDVGKRQQRRKLTELKSHVERGLWFAETYGLTLDSASFTDQKGVNHTLSFTDQEKKEYQQLPEE
jgi:chromosome segregation ATPase